MSPCTPFIALLRCKLQDISNCQKQPSKFSIKKGVLKRFAKSTGKHLCQSLFFNKVAGLRPQTCNFIEKETLAQVSSCEFCEISRNNFSYRTSPVATSASLWKRSSQTKIDGMVCSIYLAKYGTGVTTFDDLFFLWFTLGE